MKKPKADIHWSLYLFAKYVTKKIKKNENFLCIFLGRPGSGKSYSALAVAELLDPHFNIDRVAFNSAEFISVIKNEDTLPSGSVVIYDEAGTGMNSRQWFSQTNLMINYILQTFRYRNLIVFFTVPDMSYIDSHARKLFDCFVHPQRKKEREKIVFSKCLLISTDPYTGKIYNKYIRGVNPATQQLEIMTSLRIPMPSLKMRRAYEGKKHEFGMNIIKQAEAEVGTDNYRGIFTEKQIDFMKEYGMKGRTLEDIATEKGISKPALSNQKRLIEKKLKRKMTRGKESAATIPELG